MATNIHIEKNPNENNLSVLRRFRVKMKTSGILRKMKKIRFHSRSESEFKQKQSKLKRLEKKAEVEKLIKLGKISTD